ncbi:MAG: winged helix-turn-helix domain-containing protein [Pseudomonadota bacterium]
MKLVIADAQIDFDRMTVMCGGQVRRLTRQTLGILRALHDAGGDVVSKDALIARVWDGRIITDATLSTAIKEARRAVGDSGSAQRVIETVHGVGFRLAIAPQDEPETVPGSAPGATDAGLGQPCLLVLPFRNTSRDPEAQFICEGVTDEIITGLSRFRDLKVLSRATSDAIHAARIDPAEIRRRYGVDFVVEGSVRRTEARIRVSVQLTAPESGAVIVADQFDRAATVASLFDVQDQIAHLCAGRLAGPHGPVAREGAEAAQASAPYSSWTMFRLVAEFRRFYRTYDPALHARLREALPDALARHPEAADGWAALAVILLEEHRYHVNERPGVDALPPATEAAERAVAADPRNAFAQVALAMCRLFAFDIGGFEAAAHRALDLNPGHSDVLSEIGHCYAFLGREDAAIALLDKAMDISPEHPGWYHFAKTWRYARLQMFDAALLEIQKVPMPGFYWYHAHLVWLLSALDRPADAAAEAARLREIFPDFEARVHEELTMWDANADLIASALMHWRRAGLRITGAPGGAPG